MSDDRRMTKEERLELGKFIRAREKVALSGADHHEAALKADFEKKLSAEYPHNHPAWAKATAIAKQAIAEANKRIVKACKEVGVPEKFAPSASLAWASRGESMFKERRTELRKAAYAMISEYKTKAIFQIKTDSVNFLGQILADGLTTEAAKVFLKKMPTIEQLMPALAIDDVESKAKRLTDNERRELRYLSDWADDQ